MGDQKVVGQHKKRFTSGSSSIQRDAKLIAAEIRALTRKPFVSVGRRINSSPNFDVFETGK